MNGISMGNKMVKSCGGPQLSPQLQIVHGKTK